MSTNAFAHHVSAENVFPELKKHMLVDGFDFVLDLDASGGGYYVDAITKKKYLDLFTCFASIPLALNHPKLNNEKFIMDMGKLALHKPSNSDLYTETMASFVQALFENSPGHFKYSFFIEGGALAIENALKVAFDWKVRKNFKKGYTQEKGHKVLHFKQAFHGRSGYTMSLTNTDPNKVALFPKFDFPRVHNPAVSFPLTPETLERVKASEEVSIAQIERAFEQYKDDIACIILEPIQGEGGDNHFRIEFLKKLREIADKHEALLIFDEVQTGGGISGTFWVHEQLDVKPDIMAFGKKMQVCGILVGDRIDDIEDHVFRKSSRINSTWGGNLIDMARATKYMEIIKEDNLLSNVSLQGEYLQSQLHKLSQEFDGIILNSRGRGLFCAFDIKTQDLRNKFIQRTASNGLLILGCGEKSVRFRPPLDITKEHIDEGMHLIKKTLNEVL